MSRTQEMATILMHWYRNLHEGNVRHPLYRREALVAVAELSDYDAIHRICEASPEALQLVVGHPSYLIIEPSVGGQYAVSEMRYQSQFNAEEQYLRIHTVGVLNAFDAMVNLKQRYDWEMSNGH